MEEIENNINASEDLAAAKARKLDLEIQALEKTLNKKGSYGERVVPYVPIVTSLLAIAGLLFGIYQFNKQQEAQSIRELQAKEKEFKKVLWEKQLTLYTEVSKLAAQIGTTVDDKEMRKLYKDFSAYIHGDLIVVADSDVMKSVMEFDSMYVSYLSDPARQEDLLALARKIARSCRQSLIKTFSIDLGDLKDYKDSQ